MEWDPHPIDTTDVRLSTEMMQLLELLAENAHDTWGLHRLNEGWTYGRQRDDETRNHPMLLPYAELSESEKDVDRGMVLQVLKALVKIGYQIVPPRGDGPGMFGSVMRQPKRDRADQEG